MLDVIEDMKILPGLIFIVDTKKEQIAVNEARKLNIPIVAIIDTNCEPNVIDYPIPANDDSARSISLISRIIADAVIEARHKVAEEKAEQVELEDKLKVEQQPEEKETKKSDRSE